MSNNKKMYLQITSGRGPAECCRAVALILEKILRQTKELKVEAEVLECEQGVINRTLFSAIVLLEGNKCEEIAEEWEGTIQWIAQSPYRIYHKRKNWFVGIKSFTPAELSEIDTKYITYQTLRSSGAGGQHVNKTETAVRAIHAPSGLTVTASDQRSQHQNKRLATERLLIKLSEWNEEQTMRSVQKNWNNHNHLERGNPVKVINEPLVN
ncbi:peptide chain release factor H [Bacteroides sp. OttesenSCG-928-D19]|nr:peptide chain release factor H [Bacteroides sp. OttesenSCG-928-D19]